MNDRSFIKEVEELYTKIQNAKTDNLEELAKLAGLDPETDLTGINLAGANLSEDYTPTSYTEILKGDINKLPHRIGK